MTTDTTPAALADEMQRWPGYNEQSWAERFAELNARYRKLADQFTAVAALRAPAGEPVAVLRYDRATPGNENEMPRVVSCNWLPNGEYPVFLAPPAPDRDRMEPAAIIEAIQLMFENGKATLDSEGYLVSVTSPDREAIRKQAFEEAARVADAETFFEGEQPWFVAQSIAAAIRAKGEA